MSGGDGVRKEKERLTAGKRAELWRSFPSSPFVRAELYHLLSLETPGHNMSLSSNNMPGGKRLAVCHEPFLRADPWEQSSVSHSLHKKDRIRFVQDKGITIQAHLDNEFLNDQVIIGSGTIRDEGQVFLSRRL